MGTGDGGRRRVPRRFGPTPVYHRVIPVHEFPTSFISPIDRLTTGAYLKPLQYPMIASEP